MNDSALPAPRAPDSSQAQALPRLVVHVVAHTHWDREWYHGASRFRQRLVALIDALLTAPVSPERPFLLDGQAIVLEDYLAVRPEREDDIAARLQSGALEAGPWYVLADGLIPSGEAMVRNLMAGRAVLRQLGALAPAVAYCPDTFGHPAALPMVAAGFGFAVGVVWRGLGGARVASSDVFRWHAPNGDSLLLYHLSPDGYEFGSELPADAGLAVTRWERIAAVLGPRARVGVALLPSGADHHALQPDLEPALEALRHAAAPSRIVRGTLGAFAAALERAEGVEDVPNVRGELRDSYGYTWVLQGTFATRAAQKRANARVERLLLRDVEPWLVLAWLHGAPWAHRIEPDARVSLVQAPALLDQAWRTLLRAHPHDTLCGCSIDAVARDMNASLASARTQAHGLREAALAMALKHDVVKARSMSIGVVGPNVVVRNRAARARGGIAELRLVSASRDEPVGPGSAARSPAAAIGAPSCPQVQGAVVQSGTVRFEYERRESPQHYPDNDLVEAHYAVAWLPQVPALGLRTFALSSTSSRDATPLGQLPAGVMRVTSRAEGRDIVLDNGFVRVVASPSGVSVSYHGRTLPSVLSLDTTPDLGDAYTPSLRGTPELLLLREVRVGADGPLRASVELHWSAPHGAGDIRVVTTCVLDAMSRHLRIDVRGSNRRRNHRLRLLLDTDVFEASIWADAAFGPVERRPIIVPEPEQRAERVPPSMPLHRWVSAVDARRGIAVLSDGLAEVEVTPRGTIAVTLLRAIGELSRNDLPERPGHAGWPCAIPLAQSQGDFRARLGLLAHGPWSADAVKEIETATTDLLMPLTGDSWRDLESPVEEVAGFALEGDGLELSTATLATSGEGIVLRCVNVLESEVEGAWLVPSTVAGAFECTRSRLDETVLGDWTPVGSRIPIRVPARSVETILVRRPESRFAR